MSDDFDFDSYDSYDDDIYDDNNSGSNNDVVSDYYDSFDDNNSDNNEPSNDAQQEGKNTRSRTVLYVVLGCLGIPLLLSLICGGVALFTGISALAMVGDIVPMLDQIEEPGDLVITLVPTADLSILEEVAQEATATEIPPPTSTPEPAPASGDFGSLANGTSFSMQEAANISVNVADPIGITNVQIKDNGQTIDSRQFSGDAEVTYDISYPLVSDGRHLLQIEVTNRTGAREVVAETVIRVIDEEFMTQNAETFSRIESNVTAIRGLPLKEEITPYLMGEGELRRYLRAEGYTPESAQVDSIILSMFDFVDRGYDLYEASIQYGGLSIIGFYDPATKDFVLISNDNEVNALEQYTYAHEMMHALQDQHYSLGDLTDEDVGLNFEQALALRAVAEGEAELLQEIYTDQGYFTYEEEVEIFNVVQTLYRPTQTTIDPPQILVETFAFPYEKGLEFVRTAYIRNGWPGVNAVWENMPQSTEHILHPEKYYAGEAPIEVTLQSAESVLDGWTLVKDDVFGEYYLQQFFAQETSAGDAAYGAAGWGGDRYHVYVEGDPTTPNGITDVAMVWRLAWDSPTESNQFATVYSIYANSAYGTNYLEDIPNATCRQTNDVVCSYAIGDDWIIVRAPNVSMAAELINLQLNIDSTE